MYIFLIYMNVWCVGRYYVGLLMWEVLSVRKGKNVRLCKLLIKKEIKLKLFTILVRIKINYEINKPKIWQKDEYTQYKEDK